MPNDPPFICHPHLESFSQITGSRPSKSRFCQQRRDSSGPSPEYSDNENLSQSSSISFIQSILQTMTRDYSVFKVSNPPTKNSYPFLRSLNKEALFPPPRRVADGFIQAYQKFLHPILPILHRSTFTGPYDMSQTVDDTRRLDQICNGDDAVFFSTFNIVLAIGCQFSEQIEPTQRSTTASKFYQRSKTL